MYGGLARPLELLRTAQTIWRSPFCSVRNLSVLCEIYYLDIIGILVLDYKRFDDTPKLHAM